MRLNVRLFLSILQKEQANRGKNVLCNEGYRKKNKGIVYGNKKTKLEQNDERMAR